MAKIKAPKGLSEAGKGLWDDLTADYEFRPDELLLVERAARTVDLIAQMDEERADAVTAAGSMGQLVVHPLIAEIRAQSALLASIFKQLGLPDEPGAAVTQSRSVQARAAANSRWAAAHGKMA